MFCNKPGLTDLQRSSFASTFFTQKLLEDGFGYLWTAIYMLLAWINTQVLIHLRKDDVLSYVAVLVTPACF